ncbi:MAG: hypothetical protein KA113_15485 [Syntrophaceae bacterium]|nr:hypothetical protein [Syntrophaceae bacterium]
MTEISRDVAVKIESIFLPNRAAKIDNIKNRNGRFVHYTSAQNAIKIIQGKKLLMRNAKCMNDYAEIITGYNYLLDFFHEDSDKNKKLFVKTLEPFGKEIAQNSLSLFDKWWGNIEFNTFIACISEHAPNEDKHGRLSMWRAYGQSDAKAAIVLNLPFDQPGATKGLKLILSPADYDGREGLKRQLYTVIDNINNNRSFLLSMGTEAIITSIFAMLMVMAVSQKHEGFKEEMEWRVIHLPNMNSSKLISSSIETFNGVPQIVYQIPLKDDETENVTGVNIPQLVDRIIIGPSEYPFPMHQAFAAALKDAGVEKAESRVVISGIPLRT